MKTKKKISYWRVQKLPELTIIKSITELNKLNTKRLLAYYKAERMRRIRYNEFFNCYDHTYDYEHNKELYFVVDILNEWESYLCVIKSILNTREHVS